MDLWVKTTLRKRVLDFCDEYPREGGRTHKERSAGVMRGISQRDLHTLAPYFIFVSYIIYTYISAIHI